MNAHVQPPLDFEAVRTATDDGEALIVALGAYEGPLHVLLALARSQKVDLLQISIARLAEQYLAFVRAAGRLQFTLAAEYLVMAAWLAYLKSRLLLPKAARPDVADETAPEVAAARLAFRLAKLDGMRKAAEALALRPLLKRDVFMRGDPDAVKIVSRRRLEGELPELICAYVQIRERERVEAYRPPVVHTLRLDDAREKLRERLPAMADWTRLEHAAPAPGEEGAPASSCVASTLSAALEMVREGALEVRQAGVFETIWLKAAQA
ncbi:MAG TPA: ScpA family protein [Caulobacteraceae bacterium]|jgi:segregation and condensation protein A|nr:ScpA family protein [Caulobacteraceae bacterium]